MKLFKTILFAAAAILTTCLLIAAFIILFSYSTGLPANGVKTNSLDNPAAINESSAKFLREISSDQGSAPVLAKSKVGKIFKKSGETISIIKGKLIIN